MAKSLPVLTLGNFSDDFAVVTGRNNPSFIYGAKTEALEDGTTKKSTAFIMDTSAMHIDQETGYPKKDEKQPYEWGNEGRLVKRYYPIPFGSINFTRSDVDITYEGVGDETKKKRRKINFDISGTMRRVTGDTAFEAVIGQESLGTLVPGRDLHVGNAVRLRVWGQEVVAYIAGYEHSPTGWRVSLRSGATAKTKSSTSSVNGAVSPYGAPSGSGAGLGKGVNTQEQIETLDKKIRDQEYRPLIEDEEMPKAAPSTGGGEGGIKTPYNATGIISSVDYLEKNTDFARMLAALQGWALPQHGHLYHHMEENDMRSPFIVKNGGAVSTDYITGTKSWNFQLELKDDTNLKLIGFYYLTLTKPVTSYNKTLKFEVYLSTITKKLQIRNIWTDGDAESSKNSMRNNVKASMLTGGKGIEITFFNLDKQGIDNGSNNGFIDGTDGYFTFFPNVKAIARLLGEDKKTVKYMPFDKLRFTSDVLTQEELDLDDYWSHPFDDCESIEEVEEGKFNGYELNNSPY